MLKFSLENSLQSFFTSLFTNIPFQVTIDIATNLIFNHNPNLNIIGKEL